MSSNRVRLFADIMSVDAWHTPFRSNSFESQVHVEISFSEGRIGGDDIDIPFTFSVSLTRAIVTIKVQPPLAIDKTTIARSVPSAEVELVRYRSVKKKAQQSIGISGRLSLSSYFMALTGSTKKESDVTSEDESKVLEKVPPILIRPQPGGTGEYRWELEPSYQEFLEGQPWHPIDAPRLSVRSSKIIDDPMIKVTISCKREDLEIRDLQLKDDCLNSKFGQLIHRDMNEAAAVQHIKRLLEFADLEPGRLDNRFSSVLLADIISTAGNSDGI